MSAATRIAKALGIRGGIALVLALACAGLWISGEHWQGRAADWERVSGLWKAAQIAEVKAHQASKSAYRAAQADAARLEAERLTRAQLQQKEITDAVSQDHAQRLAALRARFQRMLDNADAGSDVGSATGSIAMPCLPASAQGSDEAAGKGLARSLTCHERLLAAEQALQLDMLISWIEAQSEPITLIDHDPN